MNTLGELATVTARRLRCGCEPINDKLEGQKAAAFGALHNHNRFFTSEFLAFITA